MEKGVPVHEVALPQHGKGVPAFINAQKLVVFSKKKLCFDLEMMGFFLQYYLGVMENVFHGVRRLQNSKK
jgi:hypothetical protein